MGITSSIFTNTRGRVGGVVFFKGDNGESYVRSYQPVVKNPRSAGQIETRAKVNLAGRLSGLIPPRVIYSLGNSGRKRRGALLRSFINSTSVTSSNGSFTATLDPSTVVLSKGDALLGATISSPVVVTANSVSIGLTPSDVQLGTSGETVVALAVAPQTGGINMATVADVFYDSDSEKSILMAFPQAIVDQTLVAVYRIPWEFSSEGRSVYERLYSARQEFLSQVLASQSSVRAFGDSVLATSLVFTQA